MGNLTSAETDRALHFIAFAEELDDIAELGLIIMFLDVSTEPDFLDVHDLLVLARFLLFLLHFITELAVIHDAAYRRFRLRCYVD
ncbi:hypothetical protein D3C80_1385780 [compost metagenome]